MKALVFYTPNNRPGKRDGDEFTLQAVRFAAVHKLSATDCIQVPCAKGNFKSRSDVVLDALRERKGERLDAVAFFCHGLPHWLQLGFRMGDIPDLGRAIIDSSSTSARVLFYACSMADDDSNGVGLLDTETGIAIDESFCHKLRDYLSEGGLKSSRVYGHEVPGHVTACPYYVYYVGSKTGSVSLSQGRYVIRPRGYLWNEWRAALAESKAKRPESDLAYRFPFLTLREIEHELCDPGNKGCNLP